MMILFSRPLLATALLAAASSVYAQVVLYDDLAPNGWSLAYPTAANATLDEFGDEITLATGTTRTPDNFNFAIQYYSSGFTGGEQVQVRFYLNDGGANFQNAIQPGTKFYDSGLMTLPTSTGPNTLNLNLHLNDLINLAALPDTFTWTVQFTGVSGGKSAGLAVQHPPTVGSSYNDFWENVSGVWGVYKVQDPQNPTGPGLDSSFGAQLATVPEPAAMALATGIALFGLICGRRWMYRRVA